MGNYCIAYLDENNKGFSDSEPWVEYYGKDYTMEEIYYDVEEMKSKKYKNITVFKLDELYDEEPEEYFDWNYINQRKILIVKCGRDLYELNKNDVILYNGSIWQILTKQKGLGYSAYCPVLSKKNANFLVKNGLIHEIKREYDGSIYYKTS